MRAALSPGPRLRATEWLEGMPQKPHSTYSRHAHSEHDAGPRAGTVAMPGKRFVDIAATDTVVFVNRAGP